MVKEKVRRGRLWTVMGSAIATALIGFLIWLNYGWILWNMPVWEKHLGAFALHTFGDAWQSQSQKLSGPYAINCGRVGVFGNPKAATECALKAFGGGKPFRVRYDLQGIDSDVSAGLVYTPEGTLYEVDFVGDPYGQGGTSWSKQRTDKVPCPTPAHLYVNPTGRLNCFTKEVVPPHDIMSPNFESY